MSASDNPFYTALALILGMDSDLIDIVVLSLQVSLVAVLIASALALPVGAALALWRFPGRNGLIVVLNALMGLPPVVAGLCVYLLLSRAGPLGSFGLLFTPSAPVLSSNPAVARLSSTITTASNSVGSIKPTASTVSGRSNSRTFSLTASM